MAATVASVGAGPTRVNIDSLVSEFNKWQQSLFDSEQERNEVVDKLEFMSKECVSAKEACSESKKECVDLRDSITHLQEVIHKRCNIEDDNQKLKQAIMAKEQENENLIQQHQNEIDCLQQNSKKQQMEHYTEIETVRETTQNLMTQKESDLKEVAMTDKFSFECILQEKNEEISEMQNKFAETDKRYKAEMAVLEQKSRAEIMKIRNEYDTKMVKLEKQAAKKIQTTNTTSLNQDIFRKKLQFAKTESEREIAGLKEQIKHLQQQLTMQENAARAQPGGRQGSSYPLSTSTMQAKRPRRF